MRGLNSRYIRGWQQISRLVRDEGKSFSGRERHCCFMNTGGERFAQASSATGLDYIDDGRASAIVDWDLDGDLDIWVTNRTGPRVRYLQNVGGKDANFVAFRLVGQSCNRDAIGARLEIELAGDRHRHLRTLHAGDGFLSQSTKWVHFGLGEVDVVERLIVRWPDGKTEQFPRISANQRYRITQGGGIEGWSARGHDVKLFSSELKAPPVTEDLRVVTPRTSAPNLPLQTLSGEHTSLRELAGAGPVLLNLWQTTCVPCLKELHEFSQQSAMIRDRGLNVVALHVSNPDADTDAERETVANTLKRLDYPFLAAIGFNDSIDQLDELQARILQNHRRTVFPSSLLIDASDRAVAVYKGPLSVQQLLRDADLLQKSDRELLQHSLPFVGKWHVSATNSD